MGERFMLLETMLRQEKEKGKAEGKAESILELLKDLEEVPQSIADQIMRISNLDILNALFKAARKADSMETFLKEMQDIVTR